jgi:hypothetical protein
MQHHHSFKRIRDKLIEQAKAGELIEYSYFIYGGYGVARGDGQPWKIGSVLGDICRFERENGRPLLGCICVLKATGMPSVGFWGFLGGTYSQAKWMVERDKVFKYWQSMNNKK